MILPDARSLPLASRSSRRNWVVVAWQWQGLDHYAPNRHDTGSTTSRSVDEVALIRDTISHYAPVLIAPLSFKFVRRPGRARIFFRGHRFQATTSLPYSDKAGMFRSKPDGR